MKKANIWWGMAFILMGLASCEKDIDTYSGEEGVYFNKRIRIGNILTDSTNFTFVYTEESLDIQNVIIPVQLVGRATDFDRPVAVKVAGGDAVEGTDYILPVNPVLPAGAHSFEYVITLKRTEALKTMEKTLELALEENEYFKFVVTAEVTGAQSSTTTLRHKVEFSELFASAPLAWYETEVPFNFTPQKFFLTCRVMNIPRSDFNDREKIPRTRFNYLILEMRKYIQQQLNLENPDPEIFDKDGNILFMDV